MKFAQKCPFCVIGKNFKNLKKPAKSTLSPPLPRPSYLDPQTFISSSTHPTLIELQTSSQGLFYFRPKVTKNGQFSRFWPSDPPDPPRPLNLPLPRIRLRWTLPVQLSETFPPGPPWTPKNPYFHIFYNSFWDLLVRPLNLPDLKYPSHRIYYRTSFQIALWSNRGPPENHKISHFSQNLAPPRRTPSTPPKDPLF